MVKYSNIPIIKFVTTDAQNTKNISDNQTSLNAMDDADKAHYRSLAR